MMPDVIVQRKAAVLPSFTVVLVAMLSPGVFAAPAGLAYTQESRRTHRDALGREHTEVLHQKVYAGEKSLRSETSGTNVVNIVRIDRDLIYQYDMSRGVYAEIRIEDMIRAVEAYKSGLRAVYSRMPGHKKRHLAVILGRTQPRIKVIRSAEETEISGVRCRKYSFYESGVLRLEMWLTQEYQPAGDYSRLLEANGEFSQALISERRRLGGFAMRQKIHPLLEVNPKVENKVLSIEERDLPGELFELPEGLKKVSPSMIRPEEEQEGNEEAGPDEAESSADAPETR